MRRVLDFCLWKEDWWQQQRKKRDVEDNVLLRAGLDAYVYKQAALERKIHSTWMAKWSEVRRIARPIVEGNTPEEFDEDSFDGDVVTLEVDLYDEGGDESSDDVNSYSPYQ